MMSRMADDSEFITRLISFGLSEKEAQLYLHLLKYGPKPPSLLAKSLKTYREDVYRTLTGLMDKGMVNPSLETPTVYAAVELDIALETALKKRLFGVNDAAKKLIDRGGKIRGIIDIQYSGIEAVQELLDMGEDVRHFDHYRGIIFGVFDRKICASAIREAAGLSPNSPVSMLWTDDPTFAKYLVSTFELFWEKSIPAAQRIEALLQQGSSHV